MESSMNDTLKAAGRIGAELGAAKAEIERLRGLLQQVVDCQAEHYGDGCGMHLSMITLAGRIKDALSQQAEPVEPDCDRSACGDFSPGPCDNPGCSARRDKPAPAQDDRDAFYAGLYKKSAPMWHRLHELAVSKGYDHVQFAIECAPVYRCDCMGARKVAIDMAGNTIPCECVAAANETEPAPAQGETEPVYQFQWREIGEGDWMACSNSWFRFCEASPELDTRVVEVDRPAQAERQPISRDTIRAVFLRNGFTVKEGQADLKPYVYAAAEELLRLNTPPIAQTAPQQEQSGLASAVRAYLDAIDNGSDEYDVRRARSGVRHALAAQWTAEQ
jgi:hypothetical protein